MYVAGGRGCCQSGDLCPSGPERRSVYLSWSFFKKNVMAEYAVLEGGGLDKLNNLKSAKLL